MHDTALGETPDVNSPLDIAIYAVDIYARRHPRPTHVNITQAAEMLGISRPTARKLLQAGKLSLNGCGLIPTEQIDRLLRSDYA